MKDILTFKTDEHAWLSNMTLVNIECDGIIYPSTENFYQACKYSRENKMTNSKFDDNKLIYMEYALQKKFNQEPFKSKLLATGDCHIEEGNWWKDKFWGVDIKTRQGENHLGKLIMKIRKELQEKVSNDNE